MVEEKAKYSQQIKQEATRLGFDACGITRAEYLQDDDDRLKKWLLNGYQADMIYMARNHDKRVNPAKLVPGAKSVIVVLLNYYPEKLQESPEAPVLSKYAYGRDYHFVMKEKLQRLFNYINDKLAPIEGRVFVDSAPLLERALAAKAGLGWIGKNANLISPKLGSFVFIGSIIANLTLTYDQAIPDYCGGCTKCMGACPTNAIVSPGLIDSRQCISYLTIENKKDIPNQFKNKMENRVFGCDICQDICPWNKKVKPTKEKDFKPALDLLQMTKEDWMDLEPETCRNLFRHSAVKRAKYSELRRNIDFLLND